MTYTMITASNVFTAIAKGLNVVVCDFKSKTIRYTNEMTVEDIRNTVSQPDMAFFKVEEA